MLRTYLIDETGGRTVLMLRSVRNREDYGQRVTIRAEVRDAKTDVLHRVIEGRILNGWVSMRGVQII